jgi:hypothetical protein
MKITIELTYDEARQVDWALAMRQTTLEEFIEDNPKDTDGIERTALELQACASVVHKLAPLFKAVHSNAAPQTGAERA